MGELEEKLNAILGDPQAMGQIMALAQSLGKSAPPEGEEGPAPAPPDPEEGSGEDPLSGLDPRMLDLGLRLLGEYQREDEKSAALLQALRPFLREERRAKLDKAVRIAKLSRVARMALRTIGGGEEGHV